MIQLLDKLSDEKVNELANAGRVEYRDFCGDGKDYFAIVDGDLYVKGNSYRILKRNFVEYEVKLKENGYPLKDAA